MCVLSSVSTFSTEGIVEVLMLFFNSDVVIPIFIFTPEQIENEKNSFKSSNAVQELVSTWPLSDSSGSLDSAIY